MWAKVAIAKGKLIEVLRRDVEKSKSTAKRWEKAAADKGVEMDVLKNKLATSEVKIGALKENLADLAATSL